MSRYRGHAKKRSMDAASIAPSLIGTRAGELEVAILGYGSGPALILLSHGLGDWSSLIGIGIDLSNADPDLRIFAVSRPGCGSTPLGAEAISDPLHHEANVVLPALMDALDISDASFIGHADGASVALIFAGLFPDRTRGVVGLAPYGFGDDYLRNTLEAIPFRKSGPDILLELGGRHRDPDLVYRRWRRDRLLECERRWNAAEFLDRISAPVVLIQGMRDEFISIDQSAAIASHIHGELSWIVLRSSGHFVHMESPEQVIALAQHQLKHGQAARSVKQPMLGP